MWRLLPVSVSEQAHTLAKLGEYQEALAMAALMDDAPQPGSDPTTSSASPTLLHSPSNSSSRSGGSSSGVTSPAPGVGIVKASSSGSLMAVSGGAYNDGIRSDSGGGGGSGDGGGGDGGPGVRSSRDSGRREMEDQLRLAYGHHLFSLREYDEGMAQFAQCSHTDALILLRLFPSLVPLKYRQYLNNSAQGVALPEVQEPTGPEYNRAVALLLPYLMSHRSRLIAASAAAVDESAAAAVRNGISGSDSSYNFLPVIGVDPNVDSHSGFISGEARQHVQDPLQAAENSALQETHAHNGNKDQEGSALSAFDAMRKMSLRPAQPEGRASTVAILLTIIDTAIVKVVCQFASAVLVDIYVVYIRHELRTCSVCCTFVHGFVS